jgi:Ca2+-transporting ATPase
MRTGIIIQTVMQTSAVLGAFLLGLLWELQTQGHGVPHGTNPLAFLVKFDWRSVDLDALHVAETMAFMTLSLCELFRAYTVRSERNSVFRIGVFSNKWMQYAVGSSILLLLLVCTAPFLQNVFNTHFMSGREWLIVLGLSLLPAAAEEITKLFLRLSERRRAAA